jgi:hypothetical protein
MIRDDRLDDRERCDACGGFCQSDPALYGTQDEGHEWLCDCDPVSGPGVASAPESMVLHLSERLRAASGGE